MTETVERVARAIASKLVADWDLVERGGRSTEEVVEADWLEWRDAAVAAIKAARLNKNLTGEAAATAEAPEFDAAGFAVGARPLCPFCSAPWGDGAIEAFELDAKQDFDSGRSAPVTCTISIFCEGCDREMYRKEGFKLGYI